MCVLHLNLQLTTFVWKVFISVFKFIVELFCPSLIPDDCVSVFEGLAFFKFGKVFLRIFYVLRNQCFCVVSFSVPGRSGFIGANVIKQIYKH